MIHVTGNVCDRPRHRCAPVASRTIAMAACASVLLLAGAGPARAGLIVDFWAATACADTGRPGLLSDCLGLVLDQKTNLVPGTAIASSSLGADSARSFQMAGGFDAAAAKGHSASGAGTGVSAAASASLTIAVGNDAPDPIPVSFRFLITAGALSFHAAEFKPFGDDMPVAEIRAGLVVLSPADIPPPWFYQAMLVGIGSGPALFYDDRGFTADLQHIGKPVASVERSSAGVDVTIAPFAGTLALGDLAPGNHLTLEYFVSAIAYTGMPGLDTLHPDWNPVVDAQAWIEDPFAIGSPDTPVPSSPGGLYINGESLASLIRVPGPGAVPEPSATALLAGAIVAAALATRFALANRRAG
jgi:hypothetical protein